MSYQSRQYIYPCYPCTAPYTSTSWYALHHPAQHLKSITNQCTSGQPQVRLPIKLCLQDPRNINRLLMSDGVSRIWEIKDLAGKHVQLALEPCSVTQPSAE